jgi:N-dimethylarginine dimethylaminohydrolase
MVRILENRKVLSIGLSLFAEELRRQGVEVVEVDWSPPKEGPAR